MNELITNSQCGESTGNTKISADTWEERVSSGRWLCPWQAGNLNHPEGPFQPRPLCDTVVTRAGVCLTAKGPLQPPLPHNYENLQFPAAPFLLLSSSLHSHHPKGHLHPHSPSARGLPPPKDTSSSRKGFNRIFHTGLLLPITGGTLRLTGWFGLEGNLWDPPVLTPSTGRDTFCCGQQIKEYLEIPELLYCSLCVEVMRLQQLLQISPQKLSREPPHSHFWGPMLTPTGTAEPHTH